MDRIQKRFDELDTLADQVAKSLGGLLVDLPSNGKAYEGPGIIIPNDGMKEPDPTLFEQWRLSAQTLLVRVFGSTSTTFTEFSNSFSCYLTTAQVFRRELPIFYSAKSDYEGGYLFDVRNLVHAEVFSDELEQAKYFLKAGYKTPAAVIAGVVLETTLRKLCEQADGVEPSEKLNKMNDDLAKAGVYNKMRADQIRAWAKVRNSAAHGKPDEFDEGDVNRMIEGVRDFVAAQLS